MMSILANDTLCYFICFPPDVTLAKNIQIKQQHLVNATPIYFSASATNRSH